MPAHGKAAVENDVSFPRHARGAPSCVCRRRCCPPPAPSLGRREPVCRRLEHRRSASRSRFATHGVLINPPGEQPTADERGHLRRRFPFQLSSRRSRDTLLGLTPRQPDLHRQLDAMLAQPEYPVAEVDCGEGGSDLRAARRPASRRRSTAIATSAAVEQLIPI